VAVPEVCDSLFLEVEKVVRGCQKKIVYLKNTESEVFEEAYFVVRDDALADNSECDMVKEANRILDECISLEDTESSWHKILNFTKHRIIPFLIGVSVGMIIITIIK
jgi:hypothetical protein